MLERIYQAGLIERLEKRFPGCFIMKNDSGYKQGVPDLLILHKNRWAMLEVKPSYDFSFQPNQEYYLELLDAMSFAAVICPENEVEVLNDLQHAFSARRSPRVSKR